MESLQQTSEHVWQLEQLMLIPTLQLSWRFVGFGIEILSFEAWTLTEIFPRGFGACVAARTDHADSNAPTLIKVRWISSVVFII